VRQPVDEAKWNNLHPDIQRRARGVAGMYNDPGYAGDRTAAGGAYHRMRERYDFDAREELDMIRFAFADRQIKQAALRKGVFSSHSKTPWADELTESLTDRTIAANNIREARNYQRGVAGVGNKTGKEWQRRINGRSFYSTKQIKPGTLRKMLREGWVRPTDSLTHGKFGFSPDQKQRIQDASERYKLVTGQSGAQLSARDQLNLITFGVDANGKLHNSKGEFGGDNDAVAHPTAMRMTYGKALGIAATTGTTGGIAGVSAKALVEKLKGLKRK